MRKGRLFASVFLYVLLIFALAYGVYSEVHINKTDYSKIITFSEGCGLVSESSYYTDQFEVLENNNLVILNAVRSRILNSDKNVTRMEVRLTNTCTYAVVNNE